MQTELIIVSEYCHKCQIEPSFIDLLQEEGLIEIRKEMNIICLCRNFRRWNATAGCITIYLSIWKVSMLSIIFWREWRGCVGK